MKFPSPTADSPRVLALSDLHVDHAANRARLARLPAGEHRGDVLLLGGDVTDDLELLARTLAELRQRFGRVFFVPGNHELWVRRGGFADSLRKLEAVLRVCAEAGVETRPAAVGAGTGAVWIAPLLSWYVKPEHGDDSLFLSKPGEDRRRVVWSDDHFVRWPWGDDTARAAGELLARNTVRAGRDLPVVSFSHFLPRREVMFRSGADAAAGIDAVADRVPRFNFSRVAGSAGIERQLRALGSVVHVHGHQHRDRYRQLDGVLYASHCLGYPGELDGAGRPLLRQVWPPQR